MKRTISSRKLKNNGTQLKRIDESKSSEASESKLDIQDKIQGTLLNQLNKLANQEIYNRAFETAMRFKINKNDSQMYRGKFEGKLTYKIRVLLCYKDDFFDQVKEILIKYSFEHTVNEKNFQEELEYRYDKLFQDKTYIKAKFQDTTIIYQRPVERYTKYPYMYMNKKFSTNLNTEMLSWKKTHGDPLKASTLALYLEDIAYFEKTVLEMEKVFSMKIIQGAIGAYNRNKNTSFAHTILINLGKYIKQLEKDFRTFERSSSQECKDLLMSETVVVPNNTISGVLMYLRGGFLYRAVGCLCDMNKFKGDQDKIMEILIQGIEGNQKTDKNRFFKHSNNNEHLNNKNESQCVTQYNCR